MQRQELANPGVKDIDLKCLRKILKKNTVRLVSLLKKHDDLVKMTKITPPGYRGYSVSFVPEIIKSNRVLPKIMNCARLVKIQNIEKLNNSVNNEPRAQSQQTNKYVTVNRGKKRLASDLGWGTDDDDDDIIEELQHCPRRMLEDPDCSETDEYAIYHCNLPVAQSCTPESQETDVKCNLLYSTREPEDVALPENDNAIPKRVIQDEREDSSEMTESSFKTCRCYQRNKSKPAKEFGKANLGEPEKPVCIISQVVGNASQTFSKSELETPLIELKKTNDITKIKGWRRKQFFVEKPTTIEFYRYGRGSLEKKIRLDEVEEFGEDRERDSKAVENAFVCDSLDEFLDKEADLKINYEIPHLYAEVGIKLTSEDVVSKPNLSEVEVVEVGTRYCMDIPRIKEEVNLDETLVDPSEKEQEEVMVEYYKVLKFDKNKRRIVKIEQRVDQTKSLLPRLANQQKQPAYKALPANEKSYVETDNSKPDTEPGKPQQDVSLTSKLIGAVVYPGPYRPLHPLVRTHLDKLRSYRTNIDENWANFSALAVWTKQSPVVELPRKILPVYCPGKTEKRLLPKVEFESDVDVYVNSVEQAVEKRTPVRADLKPQVKSLVTTSPGEKTTSPKISAKKSKWTGSYLKECSVVINRVVLDRDFKVWCMEHLVYDCSSCGLNTSDQSFRNDFRLRPGESRAMEMEENCVEEVMDVSQLCVTELKCVQNGFERSVSRCRPFAEMDAGTPEGTRSPRDTFRRRGTQQPVNRALFNKRLTTLLARKLRDVAFTDEILINIDKLKTIVPNDLELIKLNYVKQSFLTGHINLWYLKTKGRIRSRAFLTFTNEVPEANAVRIDRTESILTDVPKVIMELISPEKVFDKAEYAILYCNGKAWEIHGSLNIAVDNSRNKAEGKGNGKTKVVDAKPVVEVDQIFIPVPLVEMNDIRKIATRILNVKATKWWVVDLSQRFGEMVLQISSQNTVITRRHLFSIIKSGFLGFLAMRKRKGRLYGTYILTSLLPFVLVGPYYTFEPCSVSVRTTPASPPLAFSYKAMENAGQSCSLKFFINSVILAQEGSDKKLDGLWLYDKESVDNACYLETLTTDVVYSLPRTDYAVETEHGYGMNSLTSPTNPLRLNSNESSVNLDIPVYLYFNVFELGYLSGQLQEDNSILIGHPLSPDKKIKSHNIGNLFVSLLKRRVQFIPENFVPQWFITRHKQDVGGRKPFNKFILGGAHVLCNKGLLSLLRITEKKIKHLGLTKHQVLHAITNSPVIREVTALKDLKALLTKDSTTNTPMHQVLQTAVKLIGELQKADVELTKIKKDVEEHKLSLWKKYLALLSQSGTDDEDKIKLLFSVIRRRRHRKSVLNGSVREVLRKYEFGRRFLSRLTNSADRIKKVVGSGAKELEAESRMAADGGVQNGTEKTEINDMRRGATSSLRRKQTPCDRTTVRRLEAKMLKIRESLNKGGNTCSVTEHKRLVRKLKSISNQINAVKGVHKEDGKKTRASSFRTRNRITENLKKKHVMRVKRQRGTQRSRQNKEKGKENEVTDNMRNEMSEDNSNSTEASPVGENKGISVLNVTKTEEISPSKETNGKILRSSGKANGNRITGKKLVIIHRGNKKWSVQKLNVTQALKVFRKEMAEMKRTTERSEKEILHT